MTSEPAGGPVLSVVVCGAGPATDVDKLVSLAQARGWIVNLVATPSAVPFLDMPKLDAMTGMTIRSEYASPKAGSARSMSAAEAIIVAPATYNTICKLALGISDTYALGILAEAIGRGVRVVILPFVNSALASRRPFNEAVAALRTEGVRVLLGADEWTPHPPGTGGERIKVFPWHLALDALPC
jgi:phosphopantothenoylcysteine synthetase/decarboxylase